MTTTTTAKTTITKSRMHPGRFDVTIGGHFRGFILRSEAKDMVVWTAYAPGAWTPAGQAPPTMLGYADSRKACVAMMS